MGAKRSMQRKMKPVPDPVQVAQDPLLGRNYQVRRLIIKAEVDVYDNEGKLAQRGLTDDLVLTEAEFPNELIAYFMKTGRLKDGFKFYRPPEPTPPA